MAERREGFYDRYLRLVKRRGGITGPRVAPGGIPSASIRFLLKVPSDLTVLSFLHFKVIKVRLGW